MQCPDSRFIPAGAGNTKPPARPPITTPVYLAGAGNTGITVIHWPPISVYPRWRGEHCNSLISDLPRLGLSPLARGTPVPGRGCISILRFIPAGAGNTRWIRVLHSTAAVYLPLARGNTLRVNQLECKSPVYPRWRGEHVARRRNKPNKFGLSLAGAGNTRQGTITEVRTTVYLPLARGTH